MATCYQWTESPVGRLLLVADEGGLRELLFERGRTSPAIGASWKNNDHLLREAIRQLRAFFAGERQHFDLELNPQGTGFQQRVWRALQEIPFGETISYRELAGGLENKRWLLDFERSQLRLAFDR